MISHPLYKLQAWSAPLLLLDDPELRRRFIEIAEKESPTQTFKIVEALMKLERFGNGDRKFTDEEARKMAQHAHWLAILRRDHGREEFDKLVQGRR
ncbi:MAG: hypothetical protein PHE52_03105 [Candidatus Pacebacteria bacterium]|nr:hypothetical protein [Candidatus Paceibacterota bacterium]